MSIPVLQHPKLARTDDPPSFPEPRVEVVHGVIAGTFSIIPAGVILHGTRSGQSYSTEQEYQATLNYVRAGAAGLGWNVTIGERSIALHMTPRYYGWNARHHSSVHLAVEFAQANLGDPISDQQIYNFCYWFETIARESWPQLPPAFPYHSELPAGIGDGKTDPEPRGEHGIRDRILAQIGVP